MSNLATVETQEHPNELMTLPQVSATTALSIFTEKNGVDPVLQKVKDMVDAFEADASTKKGRDAIKSFAYKIAQYKTRADEAGADLTADWREKTKQVNTSRKALKEGLEAEQVRARAALTKWEEDEKTRKAAEKLAAEIQVAHETALVENDLLDRQRELDAKEAKLAADEAERKAKAEAAKAAKEQADRDERLKQEAAEKAKRDAEEAAENAKLKAEKAAADAIAETERLKREKIEADKKAETDRIAAEQKTEADKQAAIEEEQRKAKAEADRVERERLEKEAAEKDKADKLAANKAHRKTVDSEIVAAFAKHGYDEEAIVDLIAVINSGDIPRMSIGY